MNFLSDYYYFCNFCVTSPTERHSCEYIIRSLPYQQCNSSCFYLLVHTAKSLLSISPWQRRPVTYLGRRRFQRLVALLSLMASLLIQLSAERKMLQRGLRLKKIACISCVCVTFTSKLSLFFMIFSVE